MTDYWVKTLSDGTTELGLDTDKEASWTKGRQDIVFTEVVNAGKKMVVKFDFLSDEVPSWKLNDHFLASMQTGVSKRVSREVRVSRQGKSFVYPDYKHGEMTYYLNNKKGLPLPTDAEEVSFYIFEDGKTRIELHKET